MFAVLLGVALAGVGGMLGGMGSGGVGVAYSCTLLLVVLAVGLTGATLF